MKHHKKASGGGIAQEGPHQEQTNAKKKEKMEHPDEFKGKNRADHEVKVEKKHGGKVEHEKHKKVERKHGGRVPGAAAAARLDKKSRGGSPKSPLSGADAANLSYARPNLGVDAGGKGKTVKAG